MRFSSESKRKWIAGANVFVYNKNVMDFCTGSSHSLRLKSTGTGLTSGGGKAINTLT